MKQLAKLLAVFCFTLSITATPAGAQSVLNPADPVITYNPNNPPADPPWPQINKWVRTVRMWWNSDLYKCYIYKGVAFRLHFPKTYNPNVQDGKKYPMLVFYHGLGEASPVTDNEFHLLWGAQYFSESVMNGTFDGYVLFLQSQGAWGNGHYDIVKELVDYMVANNKLDQFRLSVNGLSAGGQACWEQFLRHPEISHTVMPMSSVAWYYGEQETVQKVKFTPFWNVHGGQDGSPSPYTAFLVRDSMLKYGANYRNTMYPQQAHDTWLQMWAEPDFWPTISRTYASNPWALFGKTVYNAGETINSTIGVAKGFDGYQWRRNGVLITAADSNWIRATQTGTYDARVKVGTTWSDWSIAPVKIRISDPNPPPVNMRIQAEAYTAMSGIQTETTQDVGGGLNIAWQDPGDWMDYVVTIPSAGTYTLNFRIASQFDVSQFHIRDSTGIILAAVNVPNTGYFQTWQTITTQLFLDAGTQKLRIQTARTPGGWNFNWWEISNGGVGPSNQPPTANAGTDQTIALPTTSVSLTGSGTDSDGTITGYAWSQVSGPNTATISAPTSASSTMTGLAQGTYVFRLTVTDNGNATATDDVQVTVNPAPPTGSVTRIQAENYSAMSGIQVENTSDVGGGQNVAWQDTNDWMDYVVNLSTAGTYTVNFRIATMFNGPQFQLRNSTGTVLATLNVPNTGNFQTWQTISTTVTLPAGQQTLRLFTSNAAGGWNINWWELVAPTGPQTNQPPLSNAGPDQNVTLPASTATLTGSGTDADGTIASYAWTQVSGPNTAGFSAASSATTNVTGLIQGTYVFRLTVKDNQNATGTDDVQITVLAAGSSLKIEAENYTAMLGIQTENCADAGGGRNVGWQDTGDWMDYSVNLTSSGSYTVNFRIATMFNGPQFQLRNSTGTVLATLNVPNTGNFQTWQTINTTVTLPAGQQTLRLFTSNAAGGWNINWWELVKVQAATQANPIVTANPSNELTIDRLDTAPVDVYPNPVGATLNLSVNNQLTGRLKVDIVNAAGVVVKTVALTKTALGNFRTSIPVPNLTPGAYALRASMNDWVEMKKLVKQ